MNNAFGLIVYFALLREISFPPSPPSRWFYLSTVVRYFFASTTIEI